jgi:hypothetical protein
MKRTSTLGILLIGVLFFASCKREDSINIDQQRIYSNYEYVYNSEKNESTMSATFRLDNSSGTKIELTHPARVEFNGEGLTWRNGSGNYQLKRSGSAQGGAFVYRDLEESVYTNSVSTLSYIELPFGITNISQSGNFFLPWSGSSLQAGESIRVTISGGAQTTTKSWTIHAVGSTHIILDQNKLMDLIAGSAEIQIERESSSGLQQSNLSGGRITSKYLSQKLFINITN